MRLGRMVLWSTLDDLVHEEGCIIKEKCQLAMHLDVREHWADWWRLDCPCSYKIPIRHQILQSPEPS